MGVLPWSGGLGLKERGGHLGAIKVEFASIQDKGGVLRRKQTLRTNEKFHNIHIRSAMSHTNHLIELNFRTLLNEIPSGKQFYITGNGRVRQWLTGGEDGGVGEQRTWSDT